MANLNESIKKVALAAVNEGEPATFCFGTVTSASPLKIQVQDDQKLLLTKEFLVLTKNVIDYDTEVQITWETELENGPDSHKHEIKGKKKVKILNALKQNDKVVMIKQQGGQKYLVIDKIMG
ncbi:DUF2577 domain-containing protein [Candidatus Galacturonibacter soehngenii]|uniref:DUF2577 domain-containing protein n=1 Tax=Candidatus Galacturonatibacter soehngenii TaxID=2307010 RepID=A0A7V7QJ10_9FIRM|nr:DUF2577 domain-containing protein [Candidatus Galacturonibacter soehngenii]KAB1436585.1 DUF2577 domain-containing protein [Candidatus Galacturonibacter soehngenii]MBA4688705.1 DUF2577 domain-containing protein [Candidatus Galacturonibacter soehngenii]